MKIIVLIPLAMAVALIFDSPNLFGANVASFRRLGSRVGYDGSYAWAVSGDGSTTVGFSGGIPVRWGESGGPSSLSPGAQISGHARGVSFDGSVVVASGSSGVFYWTEPQGFTSIDSLAGDFLPIEVNGVSSDGSVAVGSAYTPLGREAYRWTASTGAVPIGELPGGEPYSSAAATSADGSVIVGSSSSATAVEPFRWTVDGDIIPLRTLDGDSFTGHALDVSDDGRVIVGFTHVPTEYPFRWTEESGLVGLGPLPTGGGGAYASSVSGDGSIIVGSYETLTGSEVFIWDAHYGMRDLRALLSSQHGIHIGGWTDFKATDVSADGRVIVGYGTNPEGFEEGWQIVLPIPEPTSMILLSCIVICCLQRRETFRAPLRVCQPV